MIFKSRSRRHEDPSQEAVQAGCETCHDRANAYAILDRLFKSSSALLTWLPVIVASLGLAGGRLASRGCGKPAAQIEHENFQAARRDVQRYSAQYINAVHYADREHRDLLANYAAFREVWEAVSPREPMLIQTISPVSVDVRGNPVLPEVIRPPGVVSAENFQEFLPLLRDLQRLTIEGDGTGRGLLPATHFAAEPARDWLVPGSAF
jgi:hypothetical protein